ncbi:hypothetical protein KQI68_00115 [Peptoniphilus sp. MSJ-1]|uniref:Uncharacterized protein n=1 Tax=Peptoniphilus ovalis TaxID=2841503 RepID=A0ABS6FDI1_9FIRM|nr:hypothetical protein [Peptoniphilus ovalis]MBU5668234.1 hypothetical protein [Peptoniphilus ovalis]
MKYIIKRGIYLNIIFLLFWITLALLNFKENKENYINLIIITIIGEFAYWISIVLGAYFSKKFKS